MRKKIIVTGGAGYIGSHTVVELYSAGYNPIIIDNLCNSTEINLHGINKILNTNIKWYNVDCTDFNAMNNIFKIESNIFGCIHFAAYKSVEDSVKNPEKYFQNNIGSLNVLLSCMKENNINNIIFSSSCTVYGMPDGLPVKETAIFKNASSPYGETKQKCEQNLFNNIINSVSLRYFNPIGSHSSILIGDCSGDKASNLVPIVAEVAIGLRKKIVINGSDYNTEDGTCVRDYIHVEDLARAHVNSLDFLIKNNGKYVFNVGTGKGLSVLEIINSFEIANGVKIDVIYGPRRAGDIEAIYSDNNLIEKKLGWTSNKSLNQALRSSWAWTKKINK